MYKHLTALILVMGLALCGLAQTTNTFPSSGNVGIGTTSPLLKLDVQGGGISISGVNPIGSVNGFRNALQLINSQHAAILYNPGDSTELMFGFHKTGRFFWGSKTDGYSMSLTKAGLLRVTDGVIIGPQYRDGFRLSVDGKVAAKEVNVTTSGWADYVFQPDYQLLPLDQVETHINTYGHLPGIPNATEVAEKGIDLGEMNRKLLEKVEELTLHAINQQKLIGEQNELISAQQSAYANLLQRISKLENQQDN